MPTITPEQLVATLDPAGIKCDDAHRYAIALGLFSRDVSLDEWRRLWRAEHVKPTPPEVLTPQDLYDKGVAELEAARESGEIDEATYQEKLQALWVALEQYHNDAGDDPAEDTAPTPDDDPTAP